MNKIILWPKINHKDNIRSCWLIILCVMRMILRLLLLPKTFFDSSTTKLSRVLINKHCKLEWRKTTRSPHLDSLLEEYWEDEPWTTRCAMEMKRSMWWSSTRKQNSWMAVLLLCSTLFYHHQPIPTHPNWTSSFIRSGETLLIRFRRRWNEGVDDESAVGWWGLGWASLG